MSGRLGAGTGQRGRGPAGLEEQGEREGGAGHEALVGLEEGAARSHVARPARAQRVHLLGDLTKKQLRGGVQRSTRELEAAIRPDIELTNIHPKPFGWTKTADDILASVARFCHRISDAGD
jgi:hypothetical protein